MNLTVELQDSVIKTIKNCIRNKFAKFKPESSNMPFHFRLLGKDRMALYSFIQSLNTSFGSSIFEPVAVTIARSHFKDATTQYGLSNNISSSIQMIIQNIMNDLSIGYSPNKEEEVSKIRKSIDTSSINRISTVKADLYLCDKNGCIYLIDLKTAKPNISNFKDFKRILLEWVGIMLTENPNLNIKSLIAIPYNPYEPKPYQRWTMKGMLDLNSELLVGNEFWNFLAGKDIYEELLNCFEIAGIELRPEIENYFNRFNSPTYG